MSREHLYKAKRVNWRELPKEEWWVEGYLTQRKDSHGKVFESWIVLDAYEQLGVLNMKSALVSEIYFNCYKVDPETVCEYIGLTDKNGRKIFENDFVSCRQYIGGNWVEYCIERGYVEMKHGAFGLHRKQGYYRPFKDWLEDYEYEVIDNIFDNPELLQNNQ